MIATRWSSSPWGRTRIHLLALAAACLAGGGGCGVAPTPSGVTGNQPGATPDEVIDGFAIGPVRDTGSTSVFHQLEVAARDTWTRDHPGHPIGFTTHHAGRLADGTAQPGTDEPFTYLVVIDLAGGEHHAFVLHCSPLAALNLGDCG
jgi:hypothetical protein